MRPASVISSSILAPLQSGPLPISPRGLTSRQVQNQILASRRNVGNNGIAVSVRVRLWRSRRTDDTTMLLIPNVNVPNRFWLKVNLSSPRYIRFLLIHLEHMRRSPSVFQRHCTSVVFYSGPMRCITKDLTLLPTAVVFTRAYMCWLAD